jgi:hypothetical protein
MRWCRLPAATSSFGCARLPGRECQPDGRQHDTDANVLVAGQQYHVAHRAVLRQIGHVHDQQRIDAALFTAQADHAQTQLDVGLIGQLAVCAGRAGRRAVIPVHPQQLAATQLLCALDDEGQEILVRQGDRTARLLDAGDCLDGGGIQVTGVDKNSYSIHEKS